MKAMIKKLAVNQEIVERLAAGIRHWRWYPEYNRVTGAETTAGRPGGTQ
jgi:hypothetical protein